MNTETRKKITAGTDGADAANAKWQTPPEVFDKLQRDFGPFDIDLFADDDNHLLPRWFGPSDSNACSGIDDALAIRWPEYGRCGFGNPPYGRIVVRVLAHAKQMAREGFDSTLLLPMRVTKAFSAHVMHGATQLFLCDKRILFYENGKPRMDSKNQPQPAVFDSMIVRYMHGHYPQRPYVDLWRVPPHGGRSR